MSSINGAEQPLSLEDVSNLGRINFKFNCIRDEVRGVYRGYLSGLYLFGDPGVGKSFTVLDELKLLGANFQHHNTQLSGRGLFDALSQAPCAIHVVEDLESLMKDEK